MTATPPHDLPPTPGGYTQPTPGAAPVPVGPAGTAGTAAARTPAPARPGTLGALSLALSLVAVVGATLLSAITGFAAAEGAMRNAVALSPAGLENLTEQQLLALLAPVRGLVLWAEIGFWAGTLLGVAALALGIVAIATRRGRGAGIAGVAIAAAAPFLYSTAVGLAIVAGMSLAAV